MTSEMGAHAGNIWAMSWVIRRRQSYEYLEEDNASGGEGLGKPTAGTDWCVHKLRGRPVGPENNEGQSELLVRYRAKL